MMPCRHIMAVLKTTSPKMYSVRWLKQYQHCFKRKNKEKITDVFIQLQDLERNQNLEEWEHCNVRGMFDDDNDLPNNYPIRLYDTTEKDLQEMLKIQKDKESGKLPLRGEYCSEDDVENSTEPSQTMDIVFSQETINMRDDNERREKLNLQELQVEMLSEWKDGAEDRYHQTTTTCNEILKVIGDNKSLYHEFSNKLNSLKNEISKKAVAKLPETTQNSRIFPVHTGKSKKKVEKRKKPHWEKGNRKKRGRRKKKL